MAFNPNSTIVLCNVPIDNTYTHQIYFKTRADQREYFDGLEGKRTFTNYLTVRKTRADGSMVSSVKVDCNIDTLYNYNYMYYQNENHGTRYFYAFITNLIYINEGTTEIVFETDVFQTWFIDCNFKESYVVREHSRTDEIGDNIIPEKFAFQDYQYKKINTETALDEWGYLIGATESVFDDDFWQNLFGGVKVYGARYSGIYQGTYFYYYENIDSLNTFLKKLLDQEKDCILFITAIPKFNVSNTTFQTVFLDSTPESAISSGGWVNGTSAPAEKTIDLSFDASTYKFGNYTPKNKKLYTSPFFKLVVTNHAGEQAEYNIEDFAEPNAIQFKMYGDISATPSVTSIPQSYKGVLNNFDFGVTLGGFPQVSFNTDTFKLWLSKNGLSMGVSTLGTIASVVGGVAMLSNPATAIAGASMIGTGALGVANTITNVVEASKEPNKVSGGNARTNLLTAMKQNQFEFFIQTIKEDYAKTVDSFFTMYGYQTNALKVPNFVDDFGKRPHYNYIQTIDCNITGKIPRDDMKQLKAIFNKGVTLWKSTANIGYYSTNAPTK